MTDPQTEAEQYLLDRKLDHTIQGDGIIARLLGIMKTPWVTDVIENPPPENAEVRFQFFTDDMKRIKNGFYSQNAFFYDYNRHNVDPSFVIRYMVLPT